MTTMISDKLKIYAIPARDVVNLETGRVNVLSSTVLNGVQHYLRRLVSYIEEQCWSI